MSVCVYMGNALGAFQNREWNRFSLQHSMCVCCTERPWARVRETHSIEFPYTHTRIHTEGQKGKGKRKRKIKSLHMRIAKNALYMAHHQPANWFISPLHLFHFLLHSVFRSFCFAIVVRLCPIRFECFVSLPLAHSSLTAWTQWSLCWLLHFHDFTSK